MKILLQFMNSSDTMLSLPPSVSKVKLSSILWSSNVVLPFAETMMVLQFGYYFSSDGANLDRIWVISYVLCQKGCGFSHSVVRAAINLFLNHETHVALLAAIIVSLQYGSSSRLLFCWSSGYHGFYCSGELCHYNASSIRYDGSGLVSSGIYLL